jgi:predicted dehydrogenase
MTTTRKNRCDRRRFLGTTIGAGVGTAAGAWLHPAVLAADPPKERIKIGQIGIGHNHASAKMATFRKLADQYEVVGVVEPSPEWRKKRENDPAYRGLKWMTEEELFNTKGLKAVAVETAVPDLVPTGIRCVKAGMHIHLDKPGGETIEPFKELVDEAGRRGVAVQLGYMYRNNPAVQFCQRAVREGWLGQVFEIHAVMSRMQPLSYRKWLGQFRGGSMYIFGCHMIDLVVRMLGKPDRVTPFQRQTQPDVKVFDNGLAVLEYPRTTVTIRTASLEVEGYQRRQLVVCGDEGTIDIRPIETLDIHPQPPLRLQLALAKPRDSYRKGYQEVGFSPMKGRYDDQLIELARVMRGEIANPYPLSHELAVQEVLLEAI